MCEATDVWRVTVSMRSKIEFVSKFCVLLGRADTVQGASELALKTAQTGLGKRDAADLYVSAVERIGSLEF